MFNYVRHHAYDDIPYPRLPYAQTHPNRLAMIAKLLGMSPAPIDHCRVLELGCAVGGNLIPMAYHFPESTFVGIDKSARQIKEAQADAAALGLSNITFIQADLLDIEANFGAFDYIIAHGLYSWVPANVRDKLMAICKQSLAPQGVAYISFNTYPGGYMMRMVREIMLYHIRDIDDPIQRATEAQKFISFLVGAIPPSHKSAYWDYLDVYNRFRAESVSSKDLRFETSILHDELADINEPFYFYQFAEHAAQHGLQYLAESDFPSVMPGNFSEETVAYMQNLTQDVVAREQYGDFLRNRTFRSTLLCHDHIEVDRILRPGRVTPFYAASLAEPLETDGSNQKGVRKFRSSDGAIFKSNHPISIAAFEYLCEISPRSVSFSALLRTACDRLDIAQPSDQDAYLCAASLLQAFCYSMELIEFWMHPPEFSNRVSEKPVASPLARYLAQYDNLVVNQRHERAELDGFGYGLIGLLDGSRDHAALLDHLVGLVEDGRLKLQMDGRAIDDRERIRELLSNELELSLRWLARSALLIA